MVALGAPAAPDTLLTTADGGPALAAWAVGEGGATVVVVHGGPAAPHSYLRPEWDRLGAVARVVYYDQRGCGESADAGSYTWEDHADDLGRVVNAFDVGGPVVLAGSSWGVHLALFYALAHRDRVDGLVLTGAVPYEALRPEPLPEGYLSVPMVQREPATETERLAARERGRVWIQERTGADSAFAERLLRLDDENRDECSRVYQETHQSLASMPLADALSTLAVPALVLSGSAGERGIPDGGAGLAELLPDARLVEIEGAGHDPWYTEPDVFFRAVEAFVCGRGACGTRL